MTEEKEKELSPEEEYDKAWDESNKEKDTEEKEDEKEEKESPPETDDDGKEQPAPDEDQDSEESDDEKDYKALYESLREDYLKLVQNTRSWDGRIRKEKERADQLEEELQNLKAKFKKLPDGEAEDDIEKLDYISEQYPELADMVNILKKNVKVEKEVKKLEKQEDTSQKETPVEEKQVEDPTHMLLIREAHPDVNEIAPKVFDWIKTLPYGEAVKWDRIAQSGTANEVIQLLNEYKKTVNEKKAIKGGRKKQQQRASEAVPSSSGGPPKPKTKPDPNDFDKGWEDAISEKEKERRRYYRR